MCLVAFAYKTELSLAQGYDLVLIANRDEFFKRPAEPAHFWSDSPTVLAGRDIQGGGTWMGVARDGRFALLTNYRDPSRVRPDAKSRGLLISDFLKSRQSPSDYLKSVSKNSGAYNDFNLIAGSANGIYYFSSLNSNSNGDGVQEIKPGLYGMSNHLFETPWPKVERARSGLTRVLKESQPNYIHKESLFEILADPTPAPDALLPETGVGLEKERALSSIFITMPGYGTRCSTLLLMRRDGQIEYSERTYPEDRSLAPTTVDYPFLSQLPVRN
jgi:uncharacterized protein with NRDE domain